MRTLVWFRGKDLRLCDHAPLREGIAGGEVIPLFVVDPHFFAPGRARRIPNRIQFLLESLDELAAGIAARGSRLVIVRGRSVDVVPRVAREWRVDRVAAYAWAAPIGRERDRRISGQLDVPFDLFDGETLLPPGTVRTGAGAPYSVFTPFSRAFHRRAIGIGATHPAPSSIPALPRGVRSADTIPTLDELGLTRNPQAQTGGEAAARARLQRFLRHGGDYHRARDRMDQEGTSRLSADLKFGTLSVRHVWNRVERTMGGTDAGRTYLNELIWREFTHSTLVDHPEILDAPFRSEWAGFPWRDDERLWKAWVDGTTGYPVVDAAARQLLAEGFVHNRARMVAASFLTKHLLIDYRRGEAHYMNLLTDGDWAQNMFNWQWAAGCGADAQPYFRIFNPVTQGKRFDPDGVYVRRWVPELADVPTRYIHAPWTMPAKVRERAGFEPGVTYPNPIVDHDEARAEFLATARTHLRKARATAREQR